MRLRLAVVLLVALTLLGGGASADAAAGGKCGARALSQPFLPWLDPFDYFLLPNGGLEGGASWALGGGARVVSGNEPFYASGKSDGRSLLIPSGGWARSPSTCADFDEPTVRFFVRNTGAVLSTLAVAARVRTTVLGLSLETTLPLGVVPGTAQTWQPSLPIVFALSTDQLLGATTVDFRFEPLGPGGQWQVDDVFVDPFVDR